eukprot:gene8504-970_t
MSSARGFVVVLVVVGVDVDVAGQVEVEVGNRLGCGWGSEQLYVVFATVAVDGVGKETMSYSFLLLCLFALSLFGSAHGYAVEVDAHAEECFFDELKANTKVGLTFQVAEGGFLDIDVKINGPDGKVIYSGERETDGKYTFSAHMDGRYTYCFNNKMSTVTPKLIVFSVNIAGHEGFVVDDVEDQHDKLHDMIEELSEAVMNVKREQEYMLVRERTHRMINDSTNLRVIWWSFFETVLIILMTLGQVYYIHRFFEVKQVV